ncbi:hypothetical protein SprV_0100303900 [Sparganum proliferum]
MDPMSGKELLKKRRKLRNRYKNHFLLDFDNVETSALTSGKVMDAHAGDPAVFALLATEAASTVHATKRKETVAAPPVTSAPPPLIPRTDFSPLPVSAADRPRVNDVPLRLQERQQNCVTTTAGNQTVKQDSMLTGANNAPIETVKRQDANVVITGTFVGGNTNNCGRSVPPAAIDPTSISLSGWSEDAASLGTLDRLVARGLNGGRQACGSASPETARRGDFCGTGAGVGSTIAADTGRIVTQLGGETHSNGTDIPVNSDGGGARTAETETGRSYTSSLFTTLGGGGGGVGGGGGASLRGTRGLSTSRTGQISSSGIVGDGSSLSGGSATGLILQHLHLPQRNIESESYCNLYEGSVGVSSLVEVNGIGGAGTTGGLTDGDSGCFQNGDMSLSGGTNLTGSHIDWRSHPADGCLDKRSKAGSDGDAEEASSSAAAASPHPLPSASTGVRVSFVQPGRQLPLAGHHLQFEPTSALQMLPQPSLGQDPTQRPNSLASHVPTMALDSVTGDADHRFSELFMPRAIAPCASLESLYTSTSVSSVAAATVPSPLGTGVPTLLSSIAPAPTSTSVTASGGSSASAGLVFMNGRLGADPLSAQLHHRHPFAPPSYPSPP